jgi:MYXO-CTERM domain-containing protein
LIFYNYINICNMKKLRSFATAIAISTIFATVAPVFAQTVKDSSSATKANGSGAGNGSSQGAPDAATVSGTGTGTLADSGSSNGGGSGVKSVPAQLGATSNHPTKSASNWGLLGLFGLLGLLGLRKNNIEKT